MEGSGLAVKETQSRWEGGQACLSDHRPRPTPETLRASCGQAGATSAPAAEKGLPSLLKASLILQLQDLVQLLAWHSKPLQLHHLRTGQASNQGFCASLSDMPTPIHLL